jgi:EAL domain-containing protein (putative c-di-GMP-specific phosphodiesterase class I)
VLKEAARQLRIWNTKGIAPPSIAVNVSAMQFAQPDFIKVIESTLTAAGSERPWLEIELTESLLMKNMSDATEKLEKLHKLGVRVAIDDFGTGYSSLAYLQRLSLDTLKINHVFFDMIETGDQEAKSKSIAGAIVALAKSLDLQVVVEGIETETQRKFLIETGADLLQGFLFAAPLGGEEIEPILKRGAIITNLQIARDQQPLAKSA